MIDLDTIDILESGSNLQINPRDGDVEGLYQRLHGRHPKLAIYRRREVPARLHFSDNPRVPAFGKGAGFGSGGAACIAPGTAV